MRLETALMVIAALVTITACAASLPPAIKKEQINQHQVAKRSSGYAQYVSFKERNDGTKIHIVRNEP